MRAAVAVAGVLTTLVAAACSSSPGTTQSSGPRGELTVLSLGPVTTWDPQRLSTPQDIAFAGRTFLRTLTAFPPGRDATAQRHVVGDLATDAGSPDSTLKVWRFTLRKGISWQDGSPITCEDVRYGIARSFAQPFASEGLTYPLAYLDLPRKADGSTTFTGPSDASGQAAFDKAVSCSGSTITFRLAAPMADFSEALAMPVFAPMKKSADKGKAGTYAVFSSGPYLLKEPWDSSAGGTFVRNAKWDKASDPIRKALPDSIHYVQGTESQTAVQAVINNQSENTAAVTLDSAPPAMQQHVLSDPGLRARSVNPSSQFVDYLAPNVERGVMKNPDVRTALALATNRDSYVAALGGASAASAAYSLIGPTLPGHRSDDPLGAGSAGDAAAARTALQKSGLTLPVTVRVAYRSTPTADKAMAALSNGWQDAGFSVKLQPIAKNYFETISAPAQLAKTDVFWANWAPAWPSASTVIPPLFDSRLNLTGSGTGRDFGGFTDAKVNATITHIQSLPSLDDQAPAWADLDASLARRAVFVALAQHKSLYVAGSAVTRFGANEALGGFVDLAAIGVG
ncbi:ABC transporter substrate-binding protein [Nostocoides sp. HKS02]|uniref:ABC transporter substrate-binding protein n=1 Tax=Nostocoides sp. HKS02 TaxID=1813880 RepID=UPI0018A82020|nr:ABC transporter substrate-binding protein [Tetrasphaera sp. HKS02]